MQHKFFTVNQEIEQAIENQLKAVDKVLKKPGKNKLYEPQLVNSLMPAYIIPTIGERYKNVDKADVVSYFETRGLKHLSSDDIDQLKNLMERSEWGRDSSLFYDKVCSKKTFLAVYSILFLLTALGFTVACILIAEFEAQPVDYFRLVSILSYLGSIYFLTCLISVIENYRELKKYRADIEDHLKLIDSKKEVKENIIEHKQDIIDKLKGEINERLRFMTLIHISSFILFWGGYIGSSIIGISIIRSTNLYSVQLSSSEIYRSLFTGLAIAAITLVAISYHFAFKSLTKKNIKQDKEKIQALEEEKIEEYITLCYGSDT